MERVLAMAIITVGAFIMGALFVDLLHEDYKDHFQRSAIERGYALYCPTTGEWAWKGGCEE